MRRDMSFSLPKFAQLLKCSAYANVTSDLKRFILPRTASHSQVVSRFPESCGVIHCYGNNLCRLGVLSPHKFWSSRDPAWSHGASSHRLPRAISILAVLAPLGRLPRRSRSQIRVNGSLPLAGWSTLIDLFLFVHAQLSGSHVD